MKLYNRVPIVIGLIVFIVIASLPVWYNLASGKSAAPPELPLPDPEVHPNCVAPLEYMRSSHMVLLNEWRDSVVRDGDRIYEAYDGTKYNKSLSQTCLGCHESREQFCNQCHGYIGVEPYCWECHIDPQEIAQ